MGTGTLASPASAGTVALRLPSPSPLCSTPGKQDHTQDRRLSLAPVAPTVPLGSVVGTALPSVPPPSKVCLSFLKLNSVSTLTCGFLPGHLPEVPQHTDDWQEGRKLPPQGPPHWLPPRKFQAG